MFLIFHIDTKIILMFVHWPISSQKETIITPETIILAPKDDLLLSILDELEFKNIKVVADFEPVQVKDVTLIPTPSRNQLVPQKMNSRSMDYW
ncbi:MAG: hypothetical protein Ct9H300mP23_02050 [Nitrospinota bacterium]|nr:MAG: hypothetical protein Ct9H300mP23_02050 [Nitrospinota bacterium]